MLDVDRLHELMKEKGIVTYKDLASRINMPATTLAYMVNGHDMYVSTLISLSKFFDVPADDLIYKSYGVEVVSENDIKFYNTSNVLEGLAYGFDLSASI